MIYLARVKSGKMFARGRVHLVRVMSGWERKALCGAMTIEYVENWKTQEPVKFADHWKGAESLCKHCLRIADRE